MQLAVPSCDPAILHSYPDVKQRNHLEAATEVPSEVQAAEVVVEIGVEVAEMVLLPIETITHISYS